MDSARHDIASGLEGLPLVQDAGALAVSDAGAAARFAFRGAAGDIETAFGLSLPRRPCRAAEAGDRAALWLGPDEWLLIAPAGEATTLRRAMTAALEGRAASLVDVSHRNAGLVVDGPRAADLLASGCPLDLGLAAFQVGMCTRTLLGKAEVVLWRRAPQTFRLEVWRSFAPYVAGLLQEAARGLPPPLAG